MYSVLCSILVLIHLHLHIGNNAVKMLDITDFDTIYDKNLSVPNKFINPELACYTQFCHELITVLS